MLIRINEEEEYELYDEDKLIYKSDYLVYLIEKIIWNKTFNNPDINNLPDLCKDYLKSYKEVLQLCKKYLSE